MGNNVDRESHKRNGTIKETKWILLKEKIQYINFPEYTFSGILDTTEERIRKLADTLIAIVKLKHRTKQNDKK